LPCSLVYLTVLPSLSSIARTPTPYTSTLSLHDALPIYGNQDAFESSWPSRRSTVSIGRSRMRRARAFASSVCAGLSPDVSTTTRDRKSTRLNSSHVKISYAVFCLKKKTTTQTPHHTPLN